MKTQTLHKHTNRRPLAIMAICAVAATMLLCATGGAMAAGEPNKKTDDTGNSGSGGLWDFIDKDKIVAEGKAAWDDEFADNGGYLLLGIALALAIVSCALALIVGVVTMNLGKISGNNDTHATGKAMVGVAVLSGVLMVFGFCCLALVFSGWL